MLPLTALAEYGVAAGGGGGRSFGGFSGGSNWLDMASNNLTTFAIGAAIAGGAFLLFSR